MASQNLVWVSYLLTWGMNPGWSEIIWSTEVMDLGISYEVFLMELTNLFTFLVNGLLW